MSLVDISVAWFQKEFNRGCSIALVIVAYTIVIILLLLLYHIFDSDTQVKSCVYMLDGKKEDHDIWKSYLDMGRGDNYFIVGDEVDPTKRDKLKHVAEICPVTVWPILHFITYMVLGFLLPKFFWQLFVISCIWEMMEWFGRCHCLLDIAWNFLGLVIGWQLRRHLYPYT